MNGTPIDRLRHMQQPRQQNYDPIQSGDGFGEDLDMSGGNIDTIIKDVDDVIDIPQEQPQPKQQKIKEVPPVKEGAMNKIPIFLREPIIIVIIYVILSLDVVRKTLSTYIPQIKPSADGNVLFVGIVVYAMVLAISFVVAKRLLL